MYVSNNVEDVELLIIIEPYIIVLGSAVIIFLLLYIYLSINESTQSNSNTEDEEDAAEEKLN